MATAPTRSQPPTPPRRRETGRLRLASPPDHGPGDGDGDGDVILELSTLVALVGIAVALAASDLASRRLPNNLVLALWVAAGAVAIGVDPDVGSVGIGWAGAVAAAAGVVGVVGWLAGLFGAGDAKILPPLVGLVAWMGSLPALAYLGSTIVAGLVGLVWFIGRSRRQRPAGLPLGAVLLVGLVPAGIVLATPAAG